MSRRRNSDNRSTFGRGRGLGSPKMGRSDPWSSIPSTQWERQGPTSQKSGQRSPPSKPVGPKAAGPKTPSTSGTQGRWSRPPAPPTRQSDSLGPPPNGPQTPGPPAPTQPAPRSPRPPADTSMESTPTAVQSDSHTPSTGSGGTRYGPPALQPQRQQDHTPQVRPHGAGRATAAHDRLDALMLPTWALTARPADQGGTRGIELCLTRPGTDGLQVRAATVREARNLLADKLGAAK